MGAPRAGIPSGMSSAFPSNDPTLDPALRSWVESANDPRSEFPIQNLPFGVFRRKGTSEPARVGVAIGESVLDLAALHEAKLFEATAVDGENVFARDALNDFMAMGRRAWRSVRERVSDLLSEDNTAVRADKALHARALLPMSAVEMLLPARVGDYTDFYASVHHATNVGSMFRPDNPLLPNYKHVPIGYHGRASSLVVSGAPVKRPCGQTKADDAGEPVYGPSRLLDYELEMGFFVGQGNDLGTTIPIDRAEERIFGLALVNDWSARDIQKWEYQPLGPFLAKSFATTVAPWVVTLDALAPFRTGGAMRFEGDPQPLAYLRPGSPDQAWGLDITVEVWLRSAQMRERSVPEILISRGSFKHMFWTITQMLTHHASNGCNMRPGDLLASGTISGPEPDSRGCLLERTWRGTEPIRLPTGEERKFLADGDEVIVRGYCMKDGARRIGMGECRGVVMPANA
jgi:fumarylacetoacetase